MERITVIEPPAYELTKLRSDLYSSFFVQLNEWVREHYKEKVDQVAYVKGNNLVTWDNIFCDAE